MEPYMDMELAKNIKSIIFFFYIHLFQLFLHFVLDFSALLLKEIHNSKDIRDQ